VDQIGSGIGVDFFVVALRTEVSVTLAIVPSAAIIAVGAGHVSLNQIQSRGERGWRRTYGLVPPDRGDDGSVGFVLRRRTRPDTSADDF
jgi:hypothetical protein